MFITPKPRTKGFLGCPRETHRLPGQSCLVGVRTATMEGEEGLTLTLRGGNRMRSCTVSGQGFINGLGDSGEGRVCGFPACRGSSLLAPQLSAYTRLRAGNRSRLCTGDFDTVHLTFPQRGVAFLPAMDLWHHLVLTKCVPKGRLRGMGTKFSLE